MPTSGIPHHTERINDLEQWKCSLERYQTHTSIANIVGALGWGWGCHLMGMWGKRRGESEIRQMFSSLYCAYAWPQNASMQSKSISSPNALEIIMTMKMWFLDWDLSTVSSTTTLTAKLMSFTQYFKVCQGIPWYYHGTSPIHWGIKLFDSLCIRKSF